MSTSFRTAPKRIISYMEETPIVGTNVGGLTVLNSFFDHLHTNFPFHYVAQHLSSYYK